MIDNDDTEEVQLMIKRLMIVFWLSALFSQLIGCSVTTSGTDKTDETQFFGDTKIRDSLRICVDLQDFAISDPTTLDSAIEEFLHLLKQNTGLNNVVVEYIPSPYAFYDDASEESDGILIRKTMIDRIRVELLSGGGPDVFVVTQMHDFQDQGIDSLFPFPQEVMESGMFLPLDKYMANAQFAEWDKFPETIMNAGRNEEGQQIVPLIYTLPVILCPQAEFVCTPNRKLSWNDMLTDPELSPYAVELANCYNVDIDANTNEEIKIYQNYLEFVLGNLVDHENEELLFTEDELLQRVNEILTLGNQETNDDEHIAEEMFIGWEINSEYYPEPLTMIPMYSDDGGVAARIDSYAAVNRNTRKPEEAFHVIDYLLDDQMQRKSKIYSQFFYCFDGLPMHEELFQEDTPLLNDQFYLIGENYQELREVCEQITVANFDSELRDVLNDTLMYCAAADAFGMTVEEIVHEAYEDLQRRVRE